MIRSILLVTDGYAANAAAASAITLAARFTARITVLGVVDSPGMTRPGMGTERLGEARDRVRAALRAMHLAALLGFVRNGRAQVLSIDPFAAVAAALADQAAALLRSHGGEVAGFGIASAVDPAEMILSHVRTSGADMVVMGAYGLGGLREAIFGSATSRLLAEGAAALFLHS